MPALSLPTGVLGAQAAGSVEVVELSGPLDELAVDFVHRSIVEAGRRQAQVLVVQLDSPGALTPRVSELVDLLGAPPLPVAVWVGPAPAVAYGGAAQLLAAAPIRAAAPDTVIGYLWPTVAGKRTEDPRSLGDSLESPQRLITQTVRVDEPVPGLVDLVVPTLGGLVVGLDGLQVGSGDQAVTLHTAEPREPGEGPRPSVPVRFGEPGLFIRALRVALRPEAAFLFLVSGSVVASFEFYALGPGAAAGLALASLLLAGYGLVSLPLSWWGLPLVLAGILALTADFQRGGLGWARLAGLSLLTTGGLGLTDAAPQLGPAWWAVGLTALLAGLFYLIAMTSVARARFSTPTVGRRQLVGRRGTAASDFDPVGIVEVSGARWRARSARAAGIRSGDAIEVTGVRGAVLSVRPVSQSPGHQLP